MRCHWAVLPALEDGELRILLAVDVCDVTTEEPGVLELLVAEEADLLATLDDDGAFSGPDVGVVEVLARHVVVKVRKLDVKSVGRFDCCFVRGCDVTAWLSGCWCRTCLSFW